jgi:hypothetical protein
MTKGQGKDPVTAAIKTATLIRTVDQKTNLPDDIERLDRELRALSSQDSILVTLAEKMLDGKHHSFTSDNPETIDRAKALAEEIGVTWEVCGKSLRCRPRGWKRFA